ncbi:hypothetical protein LDENG_00070950 [Lucifuga dentata]|nr:hypothetical protein LDENG_00070950 [Lucifuga dentata]
MPSEVVCGEENQLFVQKTILGWQVTPVTQSSVMLTSEVHYVCKTQIKERITPSDIIKVLESDFSEGVGEEASVSQEDLHFLSKLKDGIKHKQDDHYEMPLPFKQDRPNLPNNEANAVQRLVCLERKLKRDQQYYSDYVNFMKDIIALGHAEKVPKQELDNQPALVYSTSQGIPTSKAREDTHCI